MDRLLQDVRFALRTLVRRPMFASVALVTLAVGIGANASLFSVVSSILLRPLRYPHAERLVWISGTREQSIGDGISYPNFVDLRDRSRNFDAMGVIRFQSINLTGGDRPERLAGAFVSAGIFEIVGGAPLLGRVFTREESELGTAREVAVIGEGVWRQRFGSDPAVVGRALTLNGQPFTVVGVMPSGFQALGASEVFIPIVYYPNAGGLERGHRSMGVVGRLRPGVTLDQARADAGAIARQLRETYPEMNAGVGLHLEGLHESLVSDMRPVVLMLFGAVGLVLVIACANVANLQLAHAMARQREMSVRVALGAGRGRIVRQLLTESLILSVLGGALGAALAYWGIRGLAELIPADLRLFHPVALDARVLGFTAALAVATGALFGLAPALHAARSGVGDVLRARSGSGSAMRLRTVSIRSVFVVAQISLSIVLLIGATLLTRSLVRLQQVDPGFDPSKLLTMEFRLPASKYTDERRIADFFTRALAEIRRVPGVESAALLRAVPLSGNSESRAYQVEGRPIVSEGELHPSTYNIVSPGYFGTMRIPLLAGREFTDDDRVDAPSVVVVDEHLAEREWPGESAIGKRIRTDMDGPWATVVGVVRSVKHFELRDQPMAQLYAPYMQDAQIFTSVAVRTRGEPMALASAVRDAIWRVDPDQPVWRLRTMETLVRDSLGSQRVTMRLLAGFAAVALLLSALGVYGVMSYVVSQRTHEVGIRMALGAARGEVVRLVLSQALRLTVAAVVIGVVASAAATRVLDSQLYGVSTTDPVTFAAVPVVLGAIALLATYVPARRASRVDPVVALRSEG
jgi:putative ABC transport system permease protein